MGARVLAGGGKPATVVPYPDLDMVPGSATSANPPNSTNDVLPKKYVVGLPAQEAHLFALEIVRCDLTNLEPPLQVLQCAVECLIPA